MQPLNKTNGFLQYKGNNPILGPTIDKLNQMSESDEQFKSFADRQNALLNQEHTDFMKPVVQDNINNNNNNNDNYSTSNSAFSGFAAQGAGALKNAYNRSGLNIYTKGIDNEFDKAAYLGIYGDSSQDPLMRATSIFKTNEERMQEATDNLKSQIGDYSGVRNNVNLANSYNNTLDSISSINYTPINVPETAALFTIGMPFLSKDKKLQDFNQSTAQGALAGLSQSGGNGWAALAGAVLGSVSSIATLAGEKERINAYNEALAKARQANIDNFYGQARLNDMNDILMAQRAGHLQAEGGSLEELNGVTKIDNGNTHEQNPYNGVQMGIASDGLPNLVEEGEIVYKDYVYSNRLKPSKSLLKQYNLPEKYAGKTFAEIGDKLQKESEDRPNDPVSLQTLNDWMSRLQNAQEEYKAKAEERRLAKVVDNMSNEEKAALLSSLEQPMTQQEGIDLSQPMYAKGGKIHIKQSKRGTFTAAAKKHGKSVQAFASQVLANKENYSPAMVKKANFSRNASKWHKHDGPSDTQYLNIGKPWEIGYIYDQNIANPTTNEGVIIDTWGTTPYPLRVQNPVVTENSNRNTFNASNLRYAPAIGAGMGALVATLQPKDYELSNRLEQLATEYKPIGAPHVGGYRGYTPYDVNLGDVENLAILASSLRANRANANRGQQTAGAIGLINAFEKQNALRNLEWQKTNEANRLATDQYNLGIDQFNAQRDSQYDQLNQQILANKINLLGQAVQARDVSKTAWANNISSTTENFYNQLGNVGRDEWNRYQFLQWLKQHPATARAWGYEG